MMSTRIVYLFITAPLLATSEDVGVRRAMRSIAVSDNGRVDGPEIVRRASKQIRTEEGESLRRVLEPFVEGRGFTPALLDKAYKALDTFGQPLPLPPRKEVDALDTDADGVTTFTELQAWQGLKDSWCRNQGEIM